MRNRKGNVLVLILAVLPFSSSALAQVYYATSGSDFRSAEAKKAAEASRASLKYDPHDLSGIWYIAAGDRKGGQFMGGAPAPPMTPWAQNLFDHRVPDQSTLDTKTGKFGEGKMSVPDCMKLTKTATFAVASCVDPAGNCDPYGFPRSLGPGPMEILQTPDKILERFHFGMGNREVFLDGRKIDMDKVDPKWYGWAVGHWEGDTLVIESTGYDERTWLDNNGYPHSEDMKLTERYRHPDAETLEITMTLEDSKAYTKPWVGVTQTYKLDLPKGLTVLYEWYCVPSEEESFNEGVRNLDGGVLSKDRPLVPSAR